jgi:hypothetical protein
MNAEGFSISYGTQVIWTHGPNGQNSKFTERWIDIAPAGVP